MKKILFLLIILHSYSNINAQLNNNPFDKLSQSLFENEMLDKDSPLSSRIKRKAFLSILAFIFFISSEVDFASTSITEKFFPILLE